MEWRAVEEAESVNGALYAVVIATYGASLVLAWFLRQAPAGRLVQLAYGQITTDIGLATAVVGLTGRVDSVFVFMFSLAVVDGAILLYRKGALLAVGMALLAYLPLVLVGPHPAVWRTIWIHGGAFVATAVLSAYLAEQLRRTGEQLAEREGDLAAVTALHESIVQSVTSGLLTLDVAGRVTFLNRAGEQMSGRNLGDVLGQPASESFGAFKTDTARGETVLALPGGTTVRLGYSSFPLVGKAQANLGTAVIFQDLTELRAMEARVARSERLADLGALAAGLAHELRNPLASMLGSVELLKASASGEDDRRLLDIVLREGGRLAQLVTEFLEFARPSSPRRREVDLAQVAAETLEAFANDPAAGKLRLVRDLAPAEVQGDPDQLRQVLWNLLVNAAQAQVTSAGSEPSGEIRVACRSSEASGATLTVEDDGPGLTPEALAELFTPFFTTKPDGTGLGLATVHRIVDAHGGAMSVDSRPGQGARFTVQLPLRR